MFHIRRPIVGAVGLLFVSLSLSGCSRNFWYRDPQVAGARQVAPCPAPAPRAYACAPTPSYGGAPAPRQARPLGTASQTPPTQPGGDAIGPASAEEMQVLAQVNAIRAQHSLRPLGFQPNLWVAARDHSLEQQRHGYMGHSSPDPKRKNLTQRMGLAGYRGRVFAEVVAWGYSDTNAVVTGWMNSPEHRRILIDPELTEAGFSRAGQYWTGNFGAPRRMAPAARYAPRTTPAPRTMPAPRRPIVPRSTPAPQQFRRATAPTPQVRRAPTPQPRRAPAPAPRRQAPVFRPPPQTGFG